MRTSTSCIVCGSEHPAGAVSQASPLAHCANCGLVSTAGGLPQGPYSLDYFSGGGYSSYFDRASQWRYEARKRLRWLLMEASPFTLVEIGCAGGFFLEVARDAGIQVLGVESSELAAGYARRVLDVPVVGGRFEDAAVEGPVDAVCAFHVLEHVDDPLTLLERARTLIASSGYLALEVPNIDSVAARIQGTDWPGLQPAFHRWHFSPRTLTRLVSKAGFRVWRCDTAFARFYARPVQRLRGVPDVLRMAFRTGSPRSVHPELGDHIRLLANPMP